MTGPVVPGDEDIPCQQVVELVTDYLEGVLDRPTRERVEVHLAGCPGCQEYLEQMRATVRLLGRVPVESLPDEARSDLLSAFRDFHGRG